MSAIISEAQKLEPSAIVSLFQLDTTVVGGPLLYFTMMTNGATPVYFNGVAYQPLDIKFEGMEMSGIGALPRPTLKIANTDSLIQEIVNTYGDLNGCALTRYRTFARFLDGQPDADPTAFFGPDVFQVDRKVSDTKAEITWELSAAIDQDGRTIGRQILRDTCLWRYRFWNGTSFSYSKAKCPYTGGTYYTEQDVVTLDPALDKPSRSITCCKLRFGENSPLPTGAFPGVSRTL